MRWSRLTRWNRRTPGLITIAAIAVGIGLLPMPYDYYMLLRLFLCGVSVYFLTRPRGVRDAEKWVLGWRLPDPKGQVGKLRVTYRPR